MQRRDFLKALAATPLLALLPHSSFSQGTVSHGTLRRVRPSDPTWPGAASWDRLNRDVGGNLIKVPPLLAACSTWLPGRHCLDALESLRNPFYLGDQPARTQVSGWLDAWRPHPSAFAVVAHGAADVAAAVNFARDNRLRLVVKGGGHSYQGTSNAPDSLLVWTRAMNAVTLHGAFIPLGCEATQVAMPAVTAEAGAMWSLSRRHDTGRAFRSRRRVYHRRGRRPRPERRLRLDVEGLRHRGGGAAGSRNRHRGWPGAEVQCVPGPGSLLGAQGWRGW